MRAAGRLFTRGYQSPNKVVGAVLYGAVPGFVLYVATKLAGQLRLAGDFDAAFAAPGPAFAAIDVGSTVPQYGKDGRA